MPIQEGDEFIVIRPTPNFPRDFRIVRLGRMTVLVGNEVEDYVATKTGLEAHLEAGNIRRIRS